MQLSSQSSALENIDLKDNWFTPDLEEDPRKTPSHKMIVAPGNNNKIITSSQSEPHVQEIPTSKGASVSEVHERPASKGFRNTSNLKSFFSQQSSNTPSGIKYRKGDKVEKGSKLTNIIYLTSYGLRRSSRLANKPKSKYGLFAKVSLEVFEACEVAKEPHVFLTRVNPIYPGN